MIKGNKKFNFIVCNINFKLLIEMFSTNKLAHIFNENFASLKKSFKFISKPLNNT